MFIGKWNKSVILTYIGAMFAVAGIFLAFSSDKITYSYCCLMMAGICDLFDGMVARRCKRTNEEKRFGIELDSLVDVISFIALPVCIFIAMGLKRIWDLPIFMLFSICGVARLGYFNIATADSEKAVKFYTGLPVTFSALIFPLIYLLKVPLPKGIFKYIFEGVTISVSILQILKIKIPKPKGIWYGILGLLAAVMLTVYLVFL